MSKNAWKTKMLNKFSEHYGELSETHRVAIDALLEVQWNISAEKAGYAFARIPALMAMGAAGTLVNLTPILPAGVLVAALGRASFMGLTYLATAYLSANALKPILPALEKLEEEHCVALFKKADDVNALIRVLGQVNQDFQTSLSGQKTATLASGVGVLAAGGVMGTMQRGSVGLPTLLSGVAPHVVVSDYSMWSVKNRFEERLQEENPGLRLRAVGRGQ